MIRYAVLVRCIPQIRRELISIKYLKKSILSILLFLCISNQFTPGLLLSADSTSGLAFVILSQYRATVKIGDEFYLAAVTSTGKLPTWKSSDSKIASVNTYGKVTAKKPGTVSITAKTKGGEASCKVTVSKTMITLNSSSFVLEHNETVKLRAETSNGSEVTFRSSKKSVAAIDEYGTITAGKPGEALLTVKADTTTKTCKVTVKPPTIKLSKTSINLYRKEQVKLTATVSSKITPTWKSNRKSVAVVSDNGTITAVKHGTALITATVDGISKTCEVTVEKPVISLSNLEISLKAGEMVTLTASVSSGIKPEWTSSNSNVVSVNDNGVVNALKKGKAFIYAQEDGTKERCIITVS